MTHIGRMEGFGIGKETTRGTAVSPTIWIPQTEANFQDKRETQADESTVGVLMSSTKVEKVKQYGEGDIKGILSSNSIGYFLLGVLGSVASAPTSGGGGAYEHDFSMNETNSKPSHTITKNTPLGVKVFPLAMISALNLSATIGEAIFANISGMSKASVSGSGSKAYAIDNKFYSKHITVKLADTLAGLDGASGNCYESIELDLTQELEDEFCFNSGVDIGDIFNKSFAINGSITRKKSDNVYEGYANDTTYKAMRIEIIDTGVTIGTADNPSVIIDLAKVSFEYPEDDAGLNDIVKETIPFVAHYDIANAKDIDIKVINTVSSY